MTRRVGKLLCCGVILRRYGVAFIITAIVLTYAAFSVAHARSPSKAPQVQLLKPLTRQQMSAAVSDSMFIVEARKASGELAGTGPGVFVKRSAGGWHEGIGGMVKYPDSLWIVCNKRLVTPGEKYVPPYSIRVRQGQTVETVRRVLVSAYDVAFLEIASYSETPSSPAVVRDAPLAPGEPVFLAGAGEIVKSKVVSLQPGDGTVQLKMHYGSPVVEGGRAIFDRFGRLSGIAGGSAGLNRTLTFPAVCSDMVAVFTPKLDNSLPWPGTESFVGGCAGPLPLSAWGRLHWHWLTICGDEERMEVQVSMDGEVVYSDELAICKRPEPSSTAATTQMTFAVKGGHAFRTRVSDSTEPLQCVIWQATSGTDDLGLGISFSSDGRAYLISGHTVRPGKETVSEIDRGIVVRTFPISPPYPLRIDRR
jgi:hypothetical protein